MQINQPFLFALFAALCGFGILSLLLSLGKMQEDVEKVSRLEGYDAFLILQDQPEFYPSLQQNLNDWIERQRYKTQPL